MTTKPHEFVPGVIFRNRCKECGVPFEHHSFPSEPEKPVDENCTCWSPDGGHDGDCAVWGDRSWPPKMETKAADLTTGSLTANIGDERINKGHADISTEGMGLVDDSGRTVYPAATNTPDTMAFVVNKSHVEPDGTRVFDEIELLSVGLDPHGLGTIETVDYPAKGINQIWQCEGCKRTFPEYVNGCPFSDNDPAHPMQRSVVAAHETWIEAVEPEHAENEALRPPELSIGEWRAWVYRQEHGWPCEACGLYTCSCPQLGYN